MVQLHDPARPPQHPPGGERVERERQRRPRVVRGQPAAPGLVVHHHELAAERVVRVVRSRGADRPVVEPVDPAGDRDQVRLGRDRPLDTGRLARRVEPGRVPFDHDPRPAQVIGGLGVVGVTFGDPAAGEQPPGGFGRALLALQPPPSGQCVVHARAQAVVRPWRPLLRRGPVQVGHPVPPGAVQPRPQPAGCARIQPARHAIESKLLHPSILAPLVALPDHRRTPGSGPAYSDGSSMRPSGPAVTQESNRRSAVATVVSSPCPARILVSPSRVSTLAPMELTWRGKSSKPPSCGTGPPPLTTSPENRTPSSSQYRPIDPGLCPGAWITSRVTSATSKTPPFSIRMSGSLPWCASRQASRSASCSATGASSRSATSKAAATCLAWPCVQITASTSRSLTTGSTAPADSPGSMTITSSSSPMIHVLT